MTALRQSPELLDRAVRTIENNLTLMALPSPENSTARFDGLAVHIGNTPIEPLPTFAGEQVSTKRELDNLSGSHYDRAYWPTIQYLEAEGLIRPGDELRDITSGSAGSSLAVLGYALGYPTRITVPDELPENRLYIMRAFDADVRRSGQGYVQAASRQQLREILELKHESAWQRIFPDDRTMRALIFEHTDGKRICYLNHSENALTPRSFASIAHEAVAQIDQPPHAVALAIGNWTTIAGISPVLRETWPATRLIGYESTDTGRYENYGMTHHDSVGTDVAVSFRDPALVDEIVQINNDDRDVMHERVNMPRATAEQLGRSSLMGLVVAEVLAKQGQTVLTLAYDHMIRN